MYIIKSAHQHYGCRKQHRFLNFVNKKDKLFIIISLLYLVEILLNIFLSNTISIKSIKESFYIKFIILQSIGKIFSLHEFFKHILELSDETNHIINLIIKILIMLLILELLCATSYSGIVSFFSFLYSLLMIGIYIKKNNKIDNIDNDHEMIISQLGTFFSRLGVQSWIIPKDSPNYIPPCCNFDKYKFLTICLFILIMSVFMFINYLVKDLSSNHNCTIKSSCV